MGGLAGPVGFDAADRLGGGPADGAGVVAARSMVMVSAATWTVTICRAWMRPRATFCPATMITPVLLARRWTVTGSVGGARWWPGRAGAAQQPGLVPGQRVGPGAEQLAGVGVEEHQRVLLDADATQPPAEDLRGDAVAAAQADVAVLADGPVDLDRGAGLGRGERRRPGGAAAAGGQRGPGRRRTGASGPILTRAPAMIRWITSVLAQNVTIIPARAGAEPELLAQRPPCSRWAAPPGRTRPARRDTGRAGCPGLPRSAGCGSGLRRVSGRRREPGPGPGRRAAAAAAAPARPAARAVLNRSAGTAIPSAWCGRVVLYSAHPRVDRGLRGGQVRERDRVVEQLPAQAAVEPLDLPGRGRRPRLGQPVDDPVVPADPVEQHLPALAEPVGELLAVVGEHLPGHPERAQRGGERQAHRPAGGPGHHRGDHAEPGMVIDPGHDLGLGPVGQEHPADDVQLPQLHRLVAFPPPVAVLAAASAGPGSISPWRTRIRYTVIRDGTGTTPALPSSCAIRSGPHRGCSRRISHTAASTSALTWCGHDSGRRDRSASPPRPPCSYRRTQVCTLCRDTPTRAATSVTGTPAATARTARYRCSTTDTSTSANPGLPPPDARKRRVNRKAESRHL